MPEDATSEAATSRGSVCVSCGYDLSGLSDSGVCPECALPIVKSRARPSLLRGADPTWLGRTHRGLSLTAAAMRVFLWMILALLGVLVLALIVGYLGVDFGDVVGNTVFLLVYAGALLAAAVLHIRGSWLLTDATFGGYAPSLHARTATRWAGVLLPVCAGYGLLMGDSVAALPRSAQLGLIVGFQLIATAYLLGLARCLETLERHIPGWSPEHAKRHRNVHKNIYGVLILTALIYVISPRAARSPGDWGIGWYGLAYVLMGGAVARVRDAVALELAIDRGSPS